MEAVARIEESEEREEQQQEQKENQENEIKLSDFLNEFGDQLRKKVLLKMKPVFTPEKSDSWDEENRMKLNGLRRKPFPSQEKAILALAKGFYKEKKKGLIFCGEMGVGKTVSALAVAYLNPKKNQRVLVMCPPHLVQKWIREAKETIPDVKVINLNGRGLKELLELRHAGKPEGIEVYVVGRERAKMHYQRKDAVVQRRKDGLPACPHCGAAFDDEEIPSGAFARKKLKCENCGSPLYQADPKGFRRFSKAEFIKRYLKGVFDLFIADEVHEEKGGDTAQGQALACLATASKRTIALTGTLMGGYSSNLFYILWRMFPGEMARRELEYRKPRSFSQAYGVMEKVEVEVLDDGYRTSSIGGERRRPIVKEKPGVSPLILTDFLLENTVFMALSDISSALPPYNEEVVAVEMTEEMKEEYESLEEDLYEEVRAALRRGAKHLLGTLVNSLLAYPDGARRGETVHHPYEDRVIACASSIDEYLLPKEQELLRIVREEKEKGRKCLVLLEHTGTRDLIPDLKERLEEIGLTVLVLRSNTVSTEKREAWVKTKLEEGDYDVMICNPNLIKTGLDLVEFPTVVFFQTGYNIFTLRQASRRSWRIGQDQPVRVCYLAYRETMQETALKLIATKLETALAIEGDLSDKGLTAIAEGANSMIYEMARSFIDKTEEKTLEEAWANYKKRELVAGSVLEDESPITEEKTTVTTFKKGDREVVSEVRRVIRGRIYRSGKALVDGKHWFLFRNGKVYFRKRQIGHYEKNGKGEINQKPIQILRVPRQRYFLLVELRE
ncbi:MAG: ATP-dependent helicase [Candidatus Wolframiiraptor sp.]|nr:MAG: ATP-dependent helicase [Candidatus Wolframiiraptor sp.]